MKTQTNTSVTPLALASMARQLLDSQNIGNSDGGPIGNNVGKDQQWFRAGFMTGITTMCMTAMQAIPTAPGAALSPLPVHGNVRLTLSDVPWDVAIIGERKAGTLIDIESGVIYDLMLMPGELDDVTWEQAKSQLIAAGGDLPSHFEMVVLSQFLGSRAFESDAYWTNVKIKFGDDAEESVSYFHDGSSDFTELNDQMSARGVRRVAVGNAADEDYKLGVPKASDAGVTGALATLRKLDDYMAASGYGADHPWRREIGSVAEFKSASEIERHHQLQWAELAALAPKVPVDDIADVLAQLQAIGDADGQKKAIRDTCASARAVIEGLLPHAGTGVAA